MWREHGTWGMLHNFYNHIIFESLFVYIYFLLWLFGWHISICFLFLSKCHLVYNKLLGDVFWSTKHVLDLHFALKPNIWNIDIHYMYVHIQTRKPISTCILWIYIHSQPAIFIGIPYIFKWKTFEAKENILLASSIRQTHTSHSLWLADFVSLVTPPGFGTSTSWEEGV